MSVMAYPTTVTGGIILDLDDLHDETEGPLKLLSLVEATALCNALRQSIIETTLAIDPGSRINSHLDRVFYA